MKTYLLYFVFFISLLICSCKKEEATPAETCKLSAIDRGNGNKHAYTYDANGRIVTMTRKFGGSSGTDPIQEFVLTFTYDNAGLLTKSDWTLEGKPVSSETYNYVGGKMTKVMFDGGENNLKYDDLGRIISISVEVGDPNYDFIQYFFYDANGIIVKVTDKTLDGTVFYETIFKPVGMVKSPEQLLSKHGLPYDIFVLSTWSANMGGIGTTRESYEQGIGGKLYLSATTKVTDNKIDANGYVSEETFIDDTNKSRTQKFTLTDCN